MKVDALATVWDGEDGVKRGKANLSAAYQRMRRSPDLTEIEAKGLFEDWLEEFDAERRRADRVRPMPVEQRDQQLAPLAREFNDAVPRLAL